MSVKLQIILFTMTNKITKSLYAERFYYKTIKTRKCYDKRYNSSNICAAIFCEAPLLAYKKS